MEEEGGQQEEHRSQDSPVEARSSRDVRIPRRPPPWAEGGLETTMAYGCGDPARRQSQGTQGLYRLGQARQVAPCRLAQVLSWEAECCWTSPPGWLRLGHPGFGSRRRWGCGEEAAVAGAGGDSESMLQM